MFFTDAQKRGLDGVRYNGKLSVVNSYKILYNELCKTRVLIGLEECVIRV